MTKPLVSILIPAYNAADWIDYTIRSAMDQTWLRKEIIIVDDGSSDGTVAKVRPFECTFLKLITQANQGAARARNRALADAQGDYVQWLDADDLLAPDKIACQMKYAAEASTRTLFSSSFGIFYFNPSRASFSPGPLWKDLSPAGWMTEKFANNTWMNPAVWLVSRELSDMAGPWNPELSLDDDGEYFSRLVTASDLVRFVPEARSYYRQSTLGSLSKSTGSNAMRSLLKSLKLSIGYLRSLEDSERTRAAACAYLQVWMRFAYPEHPEQVHELEEFARELGGQLELPSLKPQYRLIRRLFGWPAVKKTSRMVAAARLARSRHWDRLRDSLRLSTKAGRQSGSLISN